MSANATCTVVRAKGMNAKCEQRNLNEVFLDKTEIQASGLASVFSVNGSEAIQAYRVRPLPHSIVP